MIAFSLSEDGRLEREDAVLLDGAHRRLAGSGALDLYTDLRPFRCEGEGGAERVTLLRHEERGSVPLVEPTAVRVAGPLPDRLHLATRCALADGRLDCHTQGVLAAATRAEAVGEDRLAIWLDERLLLIDLDTPRVRLRGLLGRPRDRSSLSVGVDAVHALSSREAGGEGVVQRYGIPFEAFGGEAELAEGETLARGPNAYVSRDLLMGGDFFAGLRVGRRSSLLVRSEADDSLDELPMPERTAQMLPLAGVGALLVAWDGPEFRLQPYRVAAPARALEPLTLPDLGDPSDRQIDFHPHAREAGGVLVMRVFAHFDAGGWWSDRALSLNLFTWDASGQLSHLGGVDAGPRVGEGCNTACGQALRGDSTILMADRGFALMGSELVEFTLEEGLPVSARLDLEP